MDTRSGGAVVDSFKIEMFYMCRMVTLKFRQNQAISLCSFWAND